MSKESRPIRFWQWGPYYLLYLLVMVAVCGGVPLAVNPWVHRLTHPERGITMHYPMEATIEVPDVIDLAKLEPDDLSDIVPNGYMAWFTKTSPFDTIDANLISYELFLDDRRNSYDYGSYPKGSILPGGRVSRYGTVIPLAKLTPGEHVLTLVLFQRYDPMMTPRPKTTVVTKYFTVIDSSNVEVSPD